MAAVRICGRPGLLEGDIDNVTAYIRAIVRNTAMDYFRKSRPCLPMEENLIAGIEPSGNDPERAVMAKQELQMVLDKVMSMSSTDRVIVAGLIMGDGENEIACRIGKTRNAFYISLHRLRKRLGEEV